MCQNFRLRLHDLRQFRSGNPLRKTGMILDQIGRCHLPADVLPGDEQRRVIRPPGVDRSG